MGGEIAMARHLATFDAILLAMFTGLAGGMAFLYRMVRTHQQVRRDEELRLRMNWATRRRP